MVNKLHVNDITFLDISGLEELSDLIISEDAPLSLLEILSLSEINGKNIELINLELSGGADLELNISSDEVNFFVKNSLLKSELSVSHALVTFEGDFPGQTRKMNIEPDGPPETIEFKSSALSAVPVRLKSKEKWKLTGFQVKELGFLEEKKSDSKLFESVVQSGKVRMLQIGTEHNLEESDRLILGDIVESKRLRISRSDNNKVSVFFEGKVLHIKAGPEGFEKNLTPSLLEYIYHQQQIALFWSAVVFLLGLLWSIKNTIFK